MRIHHPTTNSLKLALALLLISWGNIATAVDCPEITIETGIYNIEGCEYIEPGEIWVDFFVDGEYIPAYDPDYTINIYQWGNYKINYNSDPYAYIWGPGFIIIEVIQNETGCSAIFEEEVEQNAIQITGINLPSNNECESPGGSIHIYEVTVDDIVITEDDPEFEYFSFYYYTKHWIEEENAYYIEDIYNDYTYFNQYAYTNTNYISGLEYPDTYHIEAYYYNPDSGWWCSDSTSVDVYEMNYNSNKWEKTNNTSCGLENGTLDVMEIWNGENYISKEDPLFSEYDIKLYSGRNKNLENLISGTEGYFTNLDDGNYTLEVTYSNVDGCYWQEVQFLTINKYTTEYEEDVVLSICEEETFYFGQQTLTEAGNYSEMFVSSLGCDSLVNLSLSFDLTFIEDKNHTICKGEEYDFGSQTLTLAGEYTELFTSSLGCDSLVNLSLTVNPTFEISTSAEICNGEGYMLGTQTLTQTGEYSELFSSALGCDSLVNLSLIVNPAYQESLEISICQGEEYVLGNQTLSATGEYTELFTSSLGCDSLVSINLLVNDPYEEVINLDICFGEKYLFGNTFITQSGSFSELFTSQNQCDSLVTLNLTVTEPIDNTLEVRFDTIRSNESNAEYNWYNCDTQEIVLNAHEQQFSPTESGSYYVEISKVGCTSTTSCKQVFISTLTTINNVSEVKLYPIPHKGFFTVDFGTKPFTGEIQVYDITGSIVSNDLISNQSEIQLQINGLPGIYFIHIYNALSAKHEVIKTYKK